MKKHFIISAVLILAVGYLIGTQFPAFGSNLVGKAKSIV